MSFEAVDLWLMDIGSTGFTSFKYDESILTAYDQNPNIDPMNDASEGIRSALIHSHHNMNTFYSGDDKEELEDNTPEDVDMYLSLIVNNKMEWCCVVTFRGMNTITEKYKFRPLGMKGYERITTERQEETLFVIKTEVFLEGMGHLQARYDEVLKTKLQKEKEETEKKAKMLPAHGGGHTYGNGYGGGHGYNYSPSGGQARMFEDEDDIWKKELEKEISLSNGVDPIALELPKLLMLSSRFEGIFDDALKYLDKLQGDSVRKFRNYFKQNYERVLTELEEKYNAAKELSKEDYMYNVSVDLRDEIQAWRGTKEPIFVSICQVLEVFIDNYDLASSRLPETTVEEKEHTET